MYCLCVTGFVCVLQGLVVMSADLEEVVMSVLFVCYRVWW